MCTACDTRNPRLVADGTGGAFIAWQDLRNGNDDIYVQRLNASGETAPGWATDGVPVCTDPSGQFLGLPASDGLGGVILAWSDFRNVVAGGTSVDIYAQRIFTDGSIAAGWPMNGVPVTEASTRDDTPKLIPNGAGGAFFTWDDRTNRDIYLQHLTSSGTVATGWTVGGRAICLLPGVQGAPELVSDGQAGVLIAWGDLRDGPQAAYAQRVTAAGELAPGWPENGVRIVLGRAIRGLAPDGAGGAYLSCATFGPVNDDDYFIQRFTGEGTIAPGWPAGGVPVCQAPGERNSLRMVPDGAGGVLLVWADYRDFIDDDIFALRLRADGSRYPGWPEDGLRVTDNTALDDFPDLAADGMGGAYLCWTQYTSAGGDRVMVQHLTGSGQVAPGWPAGGLMIPGSVQTRRPVITADGQEGALVAWERGLSEVRARRFAADGPVAVAVALTSAEAEPGWVRLAWFAPDAGAFSATVERRTTSGEWERRAEITADGSGRLVYEDRAVESGARYGYRLAYPETGVEAYTAEAWVEIPRLAFGLWGVTPNPSAGEPRVALSLASGAIATLEVYDVAGRQVASHEVGGLGPGRHEVRIGEPDRLRAGVYTIRLRQGEQVAKVRAVVLR